MSDVIIVIVFVWPGPLQFRASRPNSTSNYIRQYSIRVMLHWAVGTTLHCIVGQWSRRFDII